MRDDRRVTYVDVYPVQACMTLPKQGRGLCVRRSNSGTRYLARLRSKRGPLALGDVLALSGEPPMSRGYHNGTSLRSWFETFTAIWYEVCEETTATWRSKYRPKGRIDSVELGLVAKMEGEKGKEFSHPCLDSI